MAKRQEGTIDLLPSGKYRVRYRAEGKRWQVGHIIPISRGGSSNIHNLGPRHTKCNLSAGGKLGAQAQGNQVADKVKRYFRW